MPRRSRPTFLARASSSATPHSSCRRRPGRGRGCGPAARATRPSARRLVAAGKRARARWTADDYVRGLIDFLDDFERDAAAAGVTRRMRPRIAGALGSRAAPRRDAATRSRFRRRSAGWRAGGSRHSRSDEIERAEFRVFSQFGEDGIIQFLVQRVPIENQVFVEFGVEDYRESNTRFLLVHDDWRGLILDGGTAHTALPRASRLGWRTTIDASPRSSTATTSTTLIRGPGSTATSASCRSTSTATTTGSSTRSTCVSPRILVVEYNSIFGPDAR